ncbi:outer membrane protein assembly factor BamB family protein [Paenibacillus nasutitermitis]|uniref:Calcineurin-like phosphoesterase domain-containing protein n=1 Tax=Paenibacillus nasutitermitis TaxID=1652958 RepID=A0A917DWK6_9BACL|nr:PQQ-binding-like beta-propeller repeat protein [Paenibacillus nasutitermitis]GGD77264.1 hypothetical protein GCM10010911_39090 [Paenibacillus nasutitermitis]
MNLLKRSKYYLAMLALLMAFPPLSGTQANVVQAAPLAYSPQTTSSAVVNPITVNAGTVASGSSSSLKNNDQAYLQISSAASGSTHRLEYSFELTLEKPGVEVRSLTIPVNAKSSVAGVNQQLQLWNYDTLAWDSVKTSALAVTDSDLIYDTTLGASITHYVSAASQLRAKLVMEHASVFIGYYDYVNVIYEYGNSSRLAASYDATKTSLILGTLSSGTSSNLADRDREFYSIASASNKVDWSTRMTVEPARDHIRTLEVVYAGEYSNAPGTQWLSLWNYQTGNWEVIYDAPANTSNQTLRWVTSDPIAVSRYISEFGDIQVRLYNSGTASFQRKSDYLNVLIYHDPVMSHKEFSADTVTAEYGTITSGNVGSLASYDASPLVIASDASKRISWIAETALTGIDKKYVTAITVMTRAKTSTSSTNSMYFSLWNYKTSSWQVQKAQTTSTSEENIAITLSDPALIDAFISSSAGMKTRLYNSAVSATPAYSRETDLLSFTVEYGTVSTFEFAQISDVHEPIGHNNFLAVLDDINNDVQPDFTVITGDITDHGTPGQYDQFLTDAALFNNPYYVTPGNHDVRWWNVNGKEDFANEIGSLYQSFDYGGVHFILLDSTVTLELDAKFSKRLLDWVADDLQSVSKDTPVIFFAHHPFEINKNVTGKSELIDLVEDYNVVAYLSGHLHRWGNQLENGIPWVYIGQIKDYQEYIRVKVTPNKLYITRRDAANDAEVPYVEANIRNKRKNSFEITGATAQVDGDVQVAVTIADAPDGIVSLEANIDNYGGWTTLTNAEGNVWTGTVDISAYSPAIPFGDHFVAVRMLDDNGQYWKKYREYTWTGGNASTEWAFQTGGMIQAPPLVYNRTVYTGSEDGKVYAVNDISGALEWSYTTGGDILSSPAVYEQTAPLPDLVLIGSNDKKIYALNADTGSLVWSYTTGGSVISNPLVDGDVAYFGSGDMYIYAVNLSDGSLKWRYQTEGLLRQKPVIHDGKLYANVRDTYVWYALNISDGSLYWRGNAATDESLFVVADVEPMYAGGQLWVINPMPTKLSTLNPATGAVTWSDSTGDSFSSRGGATDGSTIYYPAHGGRWIFAFNASTRALKWSKDLRTGATDSDLQRYQVNSALVYEDGILYHVAERGRITGIDPATGNIKFTYDAVGFPERAIWSTPTVVDKKIYFGGIDSKLYKVEYSGT